MTVIRAPIAVCLCSCDTCDVLLPKLVHAKPLATSSFRGCIDGHLHSEAWPAGETAIFAAQLPEASPKTLPFESADMHHALSPQLCDFGAGFQETRAR